MGGEWGVGASLAMESVPPRWRGVLSGVLQEGYALGYLLAAVVYFTVFPRIRLARDVLHRRLAGAAVAVRARQGEGVGGVARAPGDGLGERTARAIALHWRRFGYLVLLMAMMNMMSHGTQDMYPTFLQQQRHFTTAGDRDRSR